MARSKSKSHILELELCFDSDNPSSVLVHASHSATSIYNAALGECLKRYRRLIRDKRYQELQEAYRNASENKKELHSRYKQLFQSIGYTEYALQDYAKDIRKNHYPGFGSAETQALATRAFKAVEKLRLRKADHVQFHSMKDGTSFEGKSSTSKLHYCEGDGCIHYGDHKFQLKIKSNDEYAQLCLMDRVKYVRVLKRKIRRKVRWFCQLVLEGIPPAKNTVYGDSAGGIDEGTSTIAVVTDHSAHLYELAPECIADEKKLQRIQRAMDRSRRSTNPENFNEDGTIRNGKRLIWKYSKRYLRLRSDLQESHRHLHVIKEISHHKLAKEILKEASNLKVESMSIQGLAKRSRKQTVRKTNGRINSKKRYGKTISRRSPARLIAILDEKLSYIGKKVIRIDTYMVKASQYNPLDGGYKKKELRDRMIKLDEGVIIQRDLLSAYCILNTTDSNDQIDADKAFLQFDGFKLHHDAEINRLRANNQLHWYIA